MRAMHYIKESFLYAIAVLGIAIFLLAYKLLRAIRPRRRSAENNQILLLTGKFSSINWIAAHLDPIASSCRFSDVVVVAEDQGYSQEGVTWVTPNVRIARSLGGTIARLSTFCSIAIKVRPQWIGGFHLLFNGMLSILLAPITGAKSMYFCVGGPAEVLGGGINSENSILGRRVFPSRVLENLLLRSSTKADSIIFMGTSARSFYVDHGFDGHAIVNPGGISRRKAESVNNFERRNIDVIFVGRLEPIKDLALFIATIEKVVRIQRQVRVLIVGEGSEREKAQEMVRELKLETAITFAGYRQDTRKLLQRSKVLLLTSKSEGLSLAMLEALTEGTPVVAPRVGDLEEALINDRNGYLVDSREPNNYAEKVAEIVGTREVFIRLSEGAIRESVRFGREAAIKRWQRFPE